MVIPCLFRYPGIDRKASHFTGIWYTDSYETVYYPVTSKISSAFQQRTSLWGDLSHRNCSLKINPLRRSDVGPFMFRIEIEDFNKYTFVHNKVSITIKGECYLLTILLSSSLLIIQVLTHKEVGLLRFICRRAIHGEIRNNSMGPEETGCTNRP